jgi:hypothetical protein
MTGIGIQERRRRDRVEARIRIRAVADPRQRNDTVKARIARAALRLDWRPGRVEDIWWGAARRIEAWEMDQLRKFIPYDQ